MNVKCVWVMYVKCVGDGEMCVGDDVKCVWVMYECEMCVGDECEMCVGDECEMYVGDECEI